MQENIINYTTCGKMIEDRLYFSERNFNGLFCYNMKSKECEFIACFKGEDISEFDLHKNCILYNEQLFFIPQRSNFIHVYHMKTGEQRNILISKQKNRKPQFLYEVLQYGSCLYNIPISIEQPLIRLDMNRQIVEEDYRFSQWCKKQLSNTKVLLGPRAAYKGNDIYVVLFETNIILRWNIFSGEGKVYQSVDGLFGISNASDGFWLLTLKCSEILHWNPENGIQSYAGTQEIFDKKPYNHVVEIEGYTIVIPTKGDNLWIKSNEENVFTKFYFKTELAFDYRELEFYGFDVDGGKLCLFFSIGRGVIVLDIKNKSAEWLLIQLENCEAIKRIETVRRVEIAKKRLQEGHTVWEFEEWSLKDLIINLAFSENSYMKRMEESGGIIYQSLYKKD